MDVHADIDRYRLLAAGLHLLPALVWLTLARTYWRSRGLARPQGGLMTLVRFLSGLLAAHYGLSIVVDIISPDAGFLYLTGCVMTKATTLAELPVLRHLILLATLGATRPGRLWQVMNYGSAILVAVATLVLGTFSDASANVVHLYMLVMTIAIISDVYRLSRDGWRPVLLADLRPRGFAILCLMLAACVLAIVLIEQGRTGPSVVWVLAHTVVGLVLAAVFALRILGEVVRRFLVALASVGAASVIYFGAQSLGRSLTSPEHRLLLDFGAVFALVLALGPGRAWLRASVNRIVLRQSRRWEEELQEFLQTLSPELGVQECGRRASVRVVEVQRLRGAGLLLEPESAIGNSPWWVAEGQLDLEPLSRIWHRATAADELPEKAFDLLWLRDLELQEALHDARVTWVVPVTSPRKRWGQLFISAGPFGIAAGGAQLETLGSFARQLALLLDGADLLGRAVAVERELAQAGKLAAVGEMAARMAHEIRNPVTAARSLAQTLAREPNSPLNAEHAGIITRELDRVETQVRSLLAFARRERYRYEPVRLGELVRAATADLEARLSSSGEQIDLVVEIDSEVRVRADPERLRQVLVNLMENALDALRETEGVRRLSISVTSDDGLAVLEVCDTGSGIDEELLPRVFEPFVSRKTQGTGLGLAIARRIVEAHQGRIECLPTAGHGSAFRVTLPQLLDGADAAVESAVADVGASDLKQAV